MTRPVYIVGAGGHGKVVCDVLQQLEIPVAAFLDRDPTKVGTCVLGVEVSDQEQTLGILDPGSVALVMGIGMGAIRREVFERLETEGFQFPALVHPSAVIGAEVSMGAGTQVMAGCVVQPGTVIGKNVVVNTASSVDHDCQLGDHAFLGPGTTLCGNVRVGSRAHIGTGATVIEDIAVGDEAYVGGGAVVVRDVAAGTKVLGVPANSA